MTASNCQIISAIATVSGKALYPYVSELLELLVPLVDSDSDAKKAAQSITIAIREDGLHYLIPELIKYAEDWRSTCNRIGALSLLGTFASDTPVTLDSTTFNQLLQITLLHFNDSEIRVQSTAIQSLDLIIKAIKVDNANYYISELRRILSLVQSDLSTANQSLPAFNLPSGLNGLLPVFLQGLRFGSPDIREQSALGIG